MPLEIIDEYRDSAFAQRQTGLLFNLPVPPPDREQLPEGVSMCMIVKNEEKVLAECLASVKDCVDEINIVDTGSTDRTVEIALAYGANVIHREWRNDFAWARNEALSMATRRWTFVLDADEELTPESVPLLRALRGTPADLTAVYIGILNAVNDESGVASMTHFLPRIFPTNPRLRYISVIHESLALDDQSVQVPGIVSPVRILHKGYTNAMLASRNKQERNRPLLERAIREAGNDSFSWFNYGVGAIGAGEFATGAEALEKMFELGKEVRTFYAVAYFTLATTYGDALHDVERGLATIERGLAQFPDHGNLVFTRAYLLSLTGRYDEARVDYEGAAGMRALAGQNFMVDDEIFVWKAYFNLASTYVKEGRGEEAIPWYERALANKPDSDLLRVSLAGAYERVGRYFDAERIHRRNAEENRPGSFVQFVNFLFRRRRFAQALEMVQRDEGRLSPSDIAVLYISASICMRDEALGDPEAYALRALEVAPGYGLGLAFLDELYASRGETEKRDRLRRAELEAPLVLPGDFIRRSYRLLEEGRAQDALSVGESGLIKAPNDNMLRYNAALAAARAGLDDVARDHLRAVRPGDDIGPAAIVLHAEIEQRAGDLEAAVAAFERASTLPRRDDEKLRSAAVSFAGSLMASGHLAQAGRVAAAALG
jgi:glycosyltransferase involved in cell wall biosynthesis